MVSSIKNDFFTSGNVNSEFRINWVKKTLQKIPKGLKILDVGAGELGYKPFCSHLDYTSQDFCGYPVGGNNKGLQREKFDYSRVDIVSDITTIPVPDNSFDAILCIEVFEHIINPTKAFEEIFRILKSDGYLILTAPYCCVTHMAPYHYFTGFTRYFYEELLKEKFDNIELVSNGNYFSFLKQEIVRLPMFARQHSKTKLNVFEKICVFFIFNILKRLDKNNLDSEDLLGFGFFVFARKMKK